MRGTESKGYGLKYWQGQKIKEADMTKSKIVEIFKRLDDEKFSLIEHGVAFEFVLKDKANSQYNQYMHTGIGDSQDMSQLILYSIVSLYTVLERNSAFKKDVSIEDFCEDIKRLAVKAYNEDLFNLQEIKNEDLGGTL